MPNIYCMVNIYVAIDEAPVYKKLEYEDTIKSRE
jgi:hypothetical protein